MEKGNLYLPWKYSYCSSVGVFVFSHFSLNKCPQILYEVILCARKEKKKKKSSALPDTKTACKRALQKLMILL